jgi:hypothetical protein
MRIRSTVSLAAAAFVLAACSENLPTDATANLDPSYASENAANPATQGNKLQCFSGETDDAALYNGTCDLVQNGAILDTNDGDLDPNNNYAGVYISNTNLDGKLLEDVNKLSFDYDGESSVGGSPRLSIPIDSDGDGDTEAYAFIDTMGCNDGDPESGTLDAINDSTCLVWYDNVSYENWAAFVAANPTYRIATDALAFVIVDQPGEFTITNVQLGRGSAKSRP